ncbi:MAG: glycosyl hydrolase family 28 protein [Nibricoccus sp.]
MACLPVRAQVQPTLLPKADQVGSANLPAEIAPVSAPFAAPQFARPKFPALRVEVASVADGQLATNVIQSAIDDVSAKHGGTVVISKGVWNIGRLVLKSNVNLHLNEGAELHFSGRVEDYQPAVFTRSEGVEVFSLGALIYANGEQNIAVTGQGKLVGPPLDCALRKQRNPVSVDKIDARTPVAERLCDGRNNGPVYLPVFIGPVNCRSVLIEGVTLERSALWNIVPLYCDGVIIRGVTIDSVNITSGDGIDIDSSRNVLIEYCTFSCGDDAVAIKSGRGEDALRVNVPSENIVMRNCLVVKAHAGISTGSETGGMVRNLYVCDSVFQEPVVGIRFKTRRPRAGGGEHLFYERIRIGRCSTAIAWDMLGEAQFVGAAASRLPIPPVTKLTPVYRDVSVNQVQVDNARFAIKVIGLPESPATKILIQNLSATTSERPIILNDVTGFVLKNAAIKSASGTIAALDARDITFENCRFDVPNDKLNLDASGELSKNIRFKNCTPRVGR